MSGAIEATSPRTAAAATPPETDLAQRLETALSAASAGGAEAMRGFRVGLAVERKSDGSPVTVADRAAERALRDAIRARHPDDGILGEELDEEPGGGDWRWIVDPIDGTAAFVAGVPLFAVLIAVEYRGDPVVGVLHFPALGETVWASRGGGTWFNGERARVSTVDRVEDARVLTTELAARPYASLDDEARAVAARVGRAWDRLRSRASLARTWGDAWGYALVATGRADVMLDPACAIWDAAALLVVVEEAGGIFTDALGRRTHAGGSAIATNSALRADVARIMNEDDQPGS